MALQASNATHPLAGLSSQLQHLLQLRTSQRLYRLGHGVTLQTYGIVICLASAGPLSQQQLATRIGCNKSYMSRLVDELESLLIVKRENHPNNRREKLVQLSAHGQRILSDVQAAVDGAAQDAFGFLAPYEQQQLIGILQTATERLQNVL